jgi:mono/diheme cytochrome c family protein
MRQAGAIAGGLVLFGLAGLGSLGWMRQQQPPTQGRMAPPGTRAPALPLDRWQAKRLPALPTGMTVDLIRSGDSLFHGKGGCVTCHGPNAEGMPNSGSALTLGLNFIPVEWKAIDSLVTAGIPEALTRTTIAMPPRGASSNLTADEVRRVAAYVWAIAQVSDEPWPGGHRTHAAAAGAAETTR